MENLPVMFSEGPRLIVLVMPEQGPFHVYTSMICPTFYPGKQHPAQCVCFQTWELSDRLS